MKKLSIIFTVAFVLGLMSSPVFAQTYNYCTDYLEPGNPGGWSSSEKTWDEMTDEGSGTIDIWLNDLRPGDTIVGTEALITYSEGLNITATAYNDQNGGPWISLLTVVDHDIGNRTIFIKLGQLESVTVDSGNDLIICKLEFTGTGEFTVSSIDGPNMFVSVVDGYIYDPMIVPNTFTVGGGGDPCEGIDCDDQDECTEDLCDPQDGCMNEPIPGCGEECDVTLSVGGAVAKAGYKDVTVEVSLENPNDEVRGLQADICEGSNNPISTNTRINPPPSDCLVCTGCETTERTSGFSCSIKELEDGCCRVVLVAQDEYKLIDRGEGPVFTLKYDVSEDCPSGACNSLNPENVKVADTLDNPLEVCTISGKLCFTESCGDIAPKVTCGDGAVDIFDVLEVIDITLGIGMHSGCQLTKADVPTGTPPNCIEPDEVVDIFDIIVIIDVVLDRENCCNYIP